MNNLERLRGKKGLTQTELAKMIGMTKAGVSIAEKSRLSAKMARKCAPILGANVFEVLGTDALRIVPSTEEEKRILISTIESL